MGNMTFLVVLACCISGAVSAYLLSGQLMDHLSSRQRNRRLQERRSRLLSGEESEDAQGETAGSPSLELMARQLLERLATKVPALRPLTESLLDANARARHDIARELPSALYTLSAALSVGQSTLQAFEYVSTSTRGRLKSLIRQLVWDLKAGIPLDVALKTLSRRSGVPEMELVCTAFALQQRSGGSMREILNAAAQSVRESFEFERSLRVQTAQARLSAKVIGIVPFVLFGLMAFISPDYLTSFFGNPLGVAMFITALVLDLVGLFAVRRIVSLGR